MGRKARGKSTGTAVSVCALLSQALLERLEDKFSLMEALESNPDLQEPEAQQETSPELFDDSSDQQPEPRPAPSAPLSYGDPILKQLRGLKAPKMMRDSGCFGRRIDRIGSLSGMGCNGESLLTQLIINGLLFMWVTVAPRRPSHGPAPQLC